MRRIEYPCLIYLARYVREVVEVLLLQLLLQKGSIFCNYSPWCESDRLMVVGLITGAIEGNLRIEVRGQFPLLWMPPRTMAIFGPMYSISTDSISMKTNGSDFEDGVRSMVRCDVCVWAGERG